MGRYTTERELIHPFVAWLASNRRVGPGSVVVEELRWSGRKVDLATLTGANRATAYEFKLNGTKRALEQAAYNGLAFDRSYVVTAVRPSETSLRMAAEVGVGVIVVERGGPRLIRPSPPSAIDPRIRRKLLRTIREASDVRCQVLPPA